MSVGLAQLTDTEPAEQCDYKPVSEKLLMEHFRTLREKGVVVIDDALSADELEAVRHDLKAMESELSCAGWVPSQWGPLLKSPHRLPCKMLMMFLAVYRRLSTPSFARVLSNPHPTVQV